jgi:DNA polymerase-3 subunit beta
MLLKIKRDTLLKPLLLTTGFVEKKQTMPILSNVYFKKVDSSITLVANDMEIQASITTSGEMSGDDFIITLPGKKLQDVLKAFPDNADIAFESQDSKVLVKSGKTKFTLQSLPAEHYPLLRVTEEAICQFAIDQMDLKQLLGQIQYAMADKDSRVFLNGMLLEIKNNQLRLVATDAHRLGLVTYTLAENVGSCSSIIPRKTILELYRLLEESDEPLLIKIYPNQVYFETKTKQLITKVIDGKYPDYERVIPLGNDKLCIIRREELLKAVERVAVIGIDKLKTLNMELCNNQLLISCRNEEQEESRDEIEVTYPSNELLKLSFNIYYVRELLSNCQAEELQWAFFDSQRSVLVTIPNELDFKSVIMPLRA